MPGIDDLQDAFGKRFGRTFYAWHIVNEIDTLAAAMKPADSSDPARVAATLSGLKRETPLGISEMRADDHQLTQTLFISELAPEPAARVSWWSRSWPSRWRSSNGYM